LSGKRNRKLRQVEEDNSSSESESDFLQMESSESVENVLAKKKAQPSKNSSKSTQGSSRSSTHPNSSTNLSGNKYIDKRLEQHVKGLDKKLRKIDS